jgi:hypothetical protein
MTLADYLDVLSILTFAIVFMSIGAAILHAIGEERLARWLRLPYGQGEDE